MIILFLLSLAFGEEPPPHRNNFSFAEADSFSTSFSVYEQVQGLKQLHPPFSNDERKQLWRLYFQSRLGVGAEDPDIFERVLELLILDYQRSPSQTLSSELIPPLYQSTLLHIQNQWSDRYPRLQNSSFIQKPLDAKTYQELSSLIENEWSEHGISWLRSFQTENGSKTIEIFRWLLAQQIPLWREEISPQFASELQNNWGLNSTDFQFSPPEQKPGQTQSPPPIQPDISVQKFSLGYQPPWRWITLFALLGLIIPLRKRKLGKLVFGLSSLLLLENTASLFIRPLIETSSYFNFHHWQLEPWQEKENYLETQGSYIRAQRFQRKKQGHRIIILGASSAHGSNHLWEDSWAGILERDTDAEVINLAIGGTTSHGILHLLPYTLELDPDFIILYYGHNEVHQFEQLMEFQQSSIQTLWIKNILWRSAIYSGLYQLLQPPASSQTTETTNTSSKRAPHPQVAGLAKWNHKQNISVLLKAYQDAEIPVILLNPPTNYPFAPVDEHFLENPVYTIAEKQTQINQSTEATTIHTYIRNNNLELAQLFGLYYLDLDQYFHQESSDQFSANGLFWDELHPSSLGQEWIASPLIPLLQEQLQSK